MTGTTFMAWEYVEPMRGLRDGTITRDGFWKCSRSGDSRERCEAWVKMPLTQSGYVPKSAVVELPAGRAWMIRDEAIADEAFEYAVLRHDLTAKECAA